MRIVITGATGLIGRALTQRALAEGHQVVALSRDATSARGNLPGETTVAEWPEPTRQPPPADSLRAADAVFHLLGEPVDQRWSAAAKRRIRDSRVLGTEQLVAGLRALPEPERPRVLVSQSATGFYGPRDGKAVEEGEPPGSDFLATVVVEWEARARAAAELGLRVVLTRTGVVLAPQGGALPRMLPPFRLGVGGPVAGGRQYVPWIHLDDELGALLHCLDHEELEGPVNLTAPHAATNRELSQALGRVLHRPAVLPVPGAALRLLYGEMASVVTTGANVRPARLERSGYRFAQPNLDPALRSLLQPRD